MTPGFGRPPDASAEGWRIDHLIDSTLVLTGVLAAVALGFLLWAGVMWRRRAQAAPLRSDTWRAIALPIAVSTLVLGVVDGRLFALSMRDLHGTFLAVDRAERDPGAVRVEVNAQRWAWNVRHAGLDGVFATDDDVVTMNDLRVPVGRPVIVQLASSDVVHSFYVPALRVKLDAVPGRVHATWFRALRGGSFEIACAQHCGIHHDRMRGVVTAMPPDAFDGWVAAASRDALAIAAEDARARAEEPTRAPPPEVDRLSDPAEARRWGWPWQAGQGRAR
jgi:cytochrome c oxidase subunit 2